MTQEHLCHCCCSAAARNIRVVAPMVMILPSIGSVRLKMSRMEVSDVTKPGFNYKTDEFKKVVLSVYIGLTIVTALLYLL